MTVDVETTSAVRVVVPTLNQKWPDYEWLFATRDATARSADRSVQFDFATCTFLRQNAVAMLGAIARELEARGATVDFLWGTMRDDVRRNLNASGFARWFGSDAAGWKGNTVPYREDANPKDAADILSFLKSEWIGKNWVRATRELANAVCGKVWEIYTNSFEHAGSPVGVFTCGQHYPNRQELCLTIVDLGVGIPANVRKFLKNQGLGGDTAIRWACQSGNSTKVGSRGLGLDLISSFVQRNGGALVIYSNNGRVRFAANEARGVKFSQCPWEFRGTVVDIRLNCDDKLYRLEGEGVPPITF